MYKKLLLTTFLLICYVEIATAQVSSNYKPQNAVASPTAAGLAKQANQTPNLYNGTVSVDIPLFSLQENQLSLSASMNYNTGGIPVNDYGTWLGLGWNLNCGGVITRKVNGFTDETNQGSFGLLTVQSKPDKYKDTFWGTIGTTLEYKDELKSIFEGAPDYKVDYATDDYYFNFMGNTGSFFFDRNNKVVSTGKMKINVDNYLSQFEIISPDGTKYIFGASEYVFTASTNYANYQLQKYWLESGYYDSQYPLLNAWYLTKVISADGNNTMDFTYDINKEFTNNQIFEYSTSEEYLPAASNTYYNQVNISKSIPALIKEIKTKNYTCSFYYNNFSAKGHHIQLIDLKTNEGEYLKSYYFEYKTIDSRRNLLSSVTEVRKDTKESNASYNFEYFDQPLNYVNNGISTSTSGIDHWGYYNGEKTTPYNTLIPNINVGAIVLNSTTTITVPARVGIDDRTPNNNAKANLLKKVTNSLGGVKELFYENNTYSYVNNTSVKTTENIAGGVRIKKIIDSDGINPLKNIVKEYEYKDPNNVNLSSGVLENEPLYNFNYNGFNYTYAHSILPISLGYSFVKEKFADGSYKTYKFTTSKDYPYIPFPEDNTFYLESDNLPDFNTPNTTFNSGLRMSLIGEPYFKTVGFIPNSTISESYYTYKKYKIKKEVHPFVNYQGQNNHLRGLLLESYDYNSAGDKVAFTKNDYITKEEGRTYSIMDKKPFDVFLYSTLPNFAYVNSYAGPGGKSNIFLSHYVKAIRFPQLSETEQRVYSTDIKTDFVSTKTNFYYNPNNNLVWKETEVGSDGGSIEKQTSYVTDFENTSMNGIIGVLKQKNMIYLPIEQRKFKKGKIVSGGLSVYNDSGKPIESYLLETNEPLNATVLQTIDSNPKAFSISSTYYKKKLDLSYDPFTKQLIEEKPSNGPVVSTLWGYKNTKPIAQVVNSEIGLGISQQTNVSTWSGIVSTAQTFFDLLISQQSVLTVRLNLTPTTNNSEQDNFQIRVFDTNSNKFVYESWYYSGNNVFTLDLPPSNYRFSCDYVSEFDTKRPSNTLIEIDKATESRNVFYSSFEDDLLNISSDAKTGKKSHIGTFGVQIPPNAGIYILSYYEKTTPTSNWVKKEETINTTGIEKIIGVGGGLIDEVRLHRNESQMTTFTHDYLGGMLSKQEVNGFINSYKYDKLGRLINIKNNNENLLKSYSFTPKLGKDFKPRVGVLIPKTLYWNKNEIVKIPLPSNLFIDDDGQIVNIQATGLPAGITVAQENGIFVINKTAVSPVGIYPVTLTGIDNAGNTMQTKIIFDLASTGSSKYKLYKAGTSNQRYFLKGIRDTEIISISDYVTLGKLNIFLDDTFFVDYVMMTMTGPVNKTTTEYRNPFGLFGDNDGFIPLPGTYTLNVKTYWFGRLNDSFNITLTFIN